jgi:hypothetical protein
MASPPPTPATEVGLIHVPYERRQSLSPGPQDVAKQYKGRREGSNKGLVAVGVTSCKSKALLPIRSGVSSIRRVASAS